MIIKLHHYDPATKSTKITELPLEKAGDRCTVWMRALPGASAVQILLQGEDGARSARVEFEATSEDAVPVAIATCPDGGLHVFRPSSQELAISQERAWAPSNATRPEVFSLPPTEKYAPGKPIVFRDNGKLDLLFLIDGTAHHSAFYQKTDTWSDHLDRLVELARKLRVSYPDLHTSRIAFGDYPLGDLASDPDLACRYAIHPDSLAQRRLQAFSDEQLREQLQNTPLTSGGDFVDALAEALQQCQQAGWRPDARKVLVLSGNSPGNSVIDPAPAGADARARGFDVDSAVADLHDTTGVELLSIYLEDKGAKPPEVLRDLLDHARKQYERLASHHTLFWTSASFDPAAAFEALEKIRSGTALAGRICYGVLEMVDPANKSS
jgi:hypothetical protein